MSGFIYFVQAGADGLIKIGWSDSDPRRRLRALQAGSPIPLWPLGLIWGNRDFERRLHRRYRELRAHSEWFRPDGHLLRFVARWTHPWERLETHPAPATPGDALARIRTPDYRNPFSLWARDRTPMRCV